MVAASLVAAVWGAVDWVTVGNPLAHWGWLLATFGIFFAAGFDLAGTVSPRRSDAELLMHRLGCTSFGPLFSAKDLGEICLDSERCTACGRCLDLCPVRVFGEPGAGGRCNVARPGACFACGACVKQCRAGALTLDDRK